MRRPYRSAFFVVVPLLIATSVGFAALWWRERRAPSGPSTDVAAAVSPAMLEVASPVSVDQPLPSIQVSPERLQRIGVTFADVRSKSAHSTIHTVGEVAIDERRVTYVQPRYSGWIRHVSVDATFQHVQVGDPLLTIDSPDVSATEQEYLLALKQQETLGRSAVSGVADGAASLLAAAEARLRQWGISDREIDRLRTSGTVSRELSVESPASGYIVERHAVPNQHVDPEARLYTITDLSTVWVNAAVLQSDLSQVRAGSSVTLTTDALPGRTLAGHVDAIYPQVDPTTRAAKARIVSANPDIALKPGMTMNVAFDLALGTQVVVPASAVFQSGTRSTLFVDHGGGSLEPRTIEIGAEVGDELTVRRGLKTGERIVTSAGFLLDSESQLKAALGAFVPPPPGAGAAAAMTSAPKTSPPSIAFTTQPSPPRAGANLFEVHLTDASGSPMSGAQVTVQHFMPAMPAMGMAAMSGTTSMRDGGNGVYSGSATLESPGTWQITVSVVSHGATVATKQLSVTTGGGTTR